MPFTLDFTQRHRRYQQYCCMQPRSATMPKASDLALIKAHPSEHQLDNCCGCWRCHCLLCRQKVAQNATSIVNRFDTLHGLKLLITQELSALDSHQAAALHQLEQLQHSCTETGGPQNAFIAQAGQCGRCRAETGVVGLVCKHCRWEPLVLSWSLSLLPQQHLVCMNIISMRSFQEQLFLLDCCACCALSRSQLRMC